MSSGDTQFGAQLSRLRRQARLSLADLASVTYVSRGWINNVEAGRRWPPRPWVERVEDVLGTDGMLLPDWDQIERKRRDHREVTKLIRSSARQSQQLIAAEPDAADLDMMNAAIADLAHAYLSSPAVDMLKQADVFRAELTRRLTSGAFRAKELSDLHIALARTSGVLAYAALDLGHDDSAATHAHLTFHLAELAGDDELKAWARGTQALVARFGRDYHKSQDFIYDGLNYAGPGTSEVRLLCGAAQSAANLGRLDRANTYLDAARRASERSRPDSVGGLFGFTPAKLAYYAGSALMWLPNHQALTTAANQSEQAIKLWQNEPTEQRSLDDEALAHVYQATALLRLGELSQAIDTVRPILDLPPERRISWISVRLQHLAQILTQDRYRRSIAARDALEEVRAYDGDQEGTPTDI